MLLFSRELFLQVQCLPRKTLAICIAGEVMENVVKDIDALAGVAFRLNWENVADKPN